jgi:hypothetical protein
MLRRTRAWRSFVAILVAACVVCTTTPATARTLPPVKMSDFDGKAVAGAFEYDGCYKDVAKVQERSLPYVIEVSPDMDQDLCFKVCGTRGFEYAGLEYGTECWCSADAPRHEKLPEAQCNTQCGRDRTAGKHSDGSEAHRCGGLNALSVFRNKGVEPPPSDDRPLVCLSIIVKNEAHTIANTLDNLVDNVDCWCRYSAISTLVCDVHFVFSSLCGARKSLCARKSHNLNMHAFTRTLQTCSTPARRTARKTRSETSCARCQARCLKSRSLTIVRRAIAQWSWQSKRPTPTFSWFCRRTNA